MSEPAGPFKVILSSVEETWNSRLRSEVSRIFQIDDETASNVVSAIPIVVLDGLDARTAGIVRERMRGLVEAGCRVVTTDDPADTIPRVNWPETPEIARVPADEPRQVITVREVDTKGPPLASFSCPGCGQVFNVSGASRVGDAHVGALEKPGASAPSGGMKPGTTKGTNGTAEKPAKHEPVKHVEPAKAAVAEPGARLHGDEWLDPPIPTKKPLESKAAPKPEPKPEPAPKPAPKPEPVKAAAAPPVEKAAPSLLDDPLLAARRYDAPATASTAPAPGESVAVQGLASSEPTTLVARPITNRFSRSVVPPPPQQPARASAAPPPVAPLPNARPSNPGGTPATGRFGAPAPEPPRPATGRFAAPPPPNPATATPPASQPRPGTNRFSNPSATAPIPPPSQFASIDSTKDAKGGKGSALDEELDVHFDDASDIQAVEKLSAKSAKSAKPSKHEDDEPAGMDEDDAHLANLLDDDLEDVPSSASRKAAAAAKDASKKKPERSPLDSDDEDDLLPFDELDSRADSRAPGTNNRSSDGSFDGGRINDLLDAEPGATVSKGGKKEPKPLLDSDDDEELLLDDEEPKGKKAPPAKGKPSLMSSDDDEELSDRSLFGDSGDQPALKPTDKLPPKGGKSKLPRESAFADALDMFESNDEHPLDADADMQGSSSSRRAPKASAAGDDEEIPEIKPLDLASDVSGIPPAKPKVGKKPESPFDKPSSSAILEPLDPNEAMAILKTHQQDDGDDPLAQTRDRPAAKKGGGGGTGPLEPLDPNEALAILGNPDDRGGKSGKGAPPAKGGKPGRMKNGRTSDPSKLVPLSASDEDFAFLEQGKGGKGAKGTDPFARAKKGPSNDKNAAISSKKRSDPFEKAQSKLDSDDEAPRAAPVAKKGGGGGGGGGGGDARPAPQKATQAKRSAPVPEGAGDCGLVLPRISTDSKRQKAAELISEIKGVAVDEALKLTERTIIPVLTGVSRDVAEFHREKFERNKISARVTTRQKEK